MKNFFVNKFNLRIFFLFSFITFVIVSACKDRNQSLNAKEIKNPYIEKSSDDSIKDIGLNGEKILFDSLNIYNSNILPLSIHIPYMVYFPEEYYSNPENDFPVLYFLPGFDGTPQTIESFIKYSKVLDSLIQKKDIPPLISVIIDPSLPAGMSTFYTNSVFTGLWEDIVTDILVGHIDSIYRTMPFREGRIIAGFSMGGFGSLYCGLKNQNVYKGIISLSGVLSPESLSQEWIKECQLGIQKDFNFYMENSDRNRNFYARLILSMYYSFGPFELLNIENGYAMPFTSQDDIIIMDKAIVDYWKNYNIENLLDSIITDPSYNFSDTVVVFFSVGKSDPVVKTFGQESLNSYLSKKEQENIIYYYYSYEGTHGGNINKAFTEGLKFVFSNL